jgi:hypothetical protein
MFFFLMFVRAVCYNFPQKKLRLFMDHSKCLRLLAQLWLYVGAILNTKGLIFFLFAIDKQECNPLLLLLSMGIGYLNGEFVFKQMVKKSVAHINSLSPPIRVTDIYDSVHYLLFGSMLGLGFFLQGLAVPSSIWAAVDAALGITIMCIGKAYLLSMKKVSLP